MSEQHGVHIDPASLPADSDPDRPRLTYGEMRRRLVQGETLDQIASSYPPEVVRLRGTVRRLVDAIRGHCGDGHDVTGCLLDLADEAEREVL